MMKIDKISLRLFRMRLQRIPGFLLCVLCSLSAINGQVPSDIPSYLMVKLAGYCEAVPWEDVYIHTDRTDYIAGEELWFNTYVVDRQQQLLSDRSKIAYIEVLNPVNMPVAQKRISIQNGTGQGHISLPDSLSTGKYTIRAYTNWMKNFLPGNCYMSDIFIYNALKDKILKSNNLTGYNEIKFTGILKQDGYSDQTLTAEVNRTGQDSVEIIFKVNDAYRSANNNICWLLIQTRGNIDRLSQIRFTTNMARAEFPAKNLAPGINQITVFNSAAQPVAERYYFTPGAQTHEISLQSPANAGKREKVVIDLDLGGDSLAEGNPAGLSVAVVPANSKSGGRDLADYLVFGSEFGYIPFLNGRNSLDGISKETLDSCLLTLKSSWIDWNRILSANFPRMKYGFEDEYHFISGRLEHNSRPADPGEFVILSKPGKNAYFQYATTGSEGRFSFMIPLSNTEQELIIQPLNTDGNPGISIESCFSGEFFQSEDKMKSQPMTIPSRISDMSRNFQVGKIYGSTHFTYPEVVAKTSADQKRFYGKPDIELIMDDYIKLPVMTEVFFELIPGVFLKSRKSVYEITMADPVTNDIYKEHPVLMIDGVIIDDASLIGNMDPELVEKIDVIKDRYVVGDFIFHGLVNIITRAGNFGEITLPRFAVRLPYKTTEQANTFKSPDYSLSEIKQSRIPDFRNTLYWNPSVKPDKSGKAILEFWSSDITGDYIIDIQGISGDGSKISEKKLFSVR